MKHFITIALGLLFVFGLTNPAFTPLTGYMKIGDIKGESQDKDHSDEIDILSWSWGETKAGATALTRSRESASGLPTGKRQHKPLTITKSIDKASPMFQRHFRARTRIPVLTVFLPKEDGSSGYSAYKLHNVMVTSYQTSGSTDDRPTETITLNYTKILHNQSDLDFLKERARRK